jgi:hypothetical protein
MHDNPFFVSESSLGEGEISELVKGEEGKRVSEADASSQSSSSKSLQIVTGSSQDGKEIESPSSPRVKPHIGANMRSALLHLISDSMRSITTLVQERLPSIHPQPSNNNTTHAPLYLVHSFM